MKVLSAECYGTENDIFELEILQHLQRFKNNYNGHQYISALENSFEHEGPNGKHVCLILNVMAESLSSFPSWFDEEQIPVPLVKRFVSQILQAIEFAHSCGVIHTGKYSRITSESRFSSFADIQPGNIMVQLPDKACIETYLKATAVPEEASSSPADTSSIPEYAIVSTQGLRDFYVGEGFNMMKLDIALSDWGVSSWKDKHLTELIQPVLLRAPEVILEAPWGPAVDIWNLGALIPEFIYAQQMFSGRNKAGKYIAKVHLEEMDKLFGPFPPTILAQAHAEKEAIGEDGHVLNGELDRFTGLEQRFANMQVEERDNFISLLSGMLCLDPDKRKSAKEVLSEPWLVLK